MQIIIIHVPCQRVQQWCLAEHSTYSLLYVVAKTHFMLYRLLTHNNQQTNEHLSCKSACPEVFFSPLPSNINKTLFHLAYFPLGPMYHVLRLFSNYSILSVFKFIVLMEGALLVGWWFHFTIWFVFNCLVPDRSR